VPVSNNPMSIPYSSVRQKLSNAGLLATEALAQHSHAGVAPVVEAYS
jgi:hypothetical protein